LDVVTRYYRLVTWPATVGYHFIIQVCSMSIRLHSDVASVQTWDCILLGAANVYLWLNSVDWRGSNFYNPHNSVDRTWRRPWAWEQNCHLRCWPPKKLSPCYCRRRLLELGGCWLGKVQIKLCLCCCVERHGATPSLTGCISGPFKWPSLR